MMNKTSLELFRKTLTNAIIVETDWSRFRRTSQQLFTQDELNEVGEQIEQLVDKLQRMHGHAKVNTPDVPVTEA